MESPAEKKTIRVACRHCGGVMRARPEHAGRPAECPKCGRVIRLDEAPALEHPSGLPKPKPAPAVAAPTTASVACRLCGTRMTFSLKHVGRKAKCPDCGVLTVIPPPSPPPAPRVPTALNGPQYEVWRGDDQPRGVDLARDEEPSLRVRCERCQTVIVAEPGQVGQRVACPDCGRQNLVKPRATSTARPDPRAMASYPVDRAQSGGGGLPVEAWAPAETDAERNEFVRAARPDLPRWPMLTGVLAFVKSPGFVPRWLALSLAFGAVALLGWFAASQLAGAVGAGSLGPLGYIVAAAVGLAGAILGLLTAAAAASHAMAIITESSEGNDRIYGWPGTSPADWFGDFFVIAIAVAAAAIPGWAAGSAAQSLFPAVGPAAPALAALAGAVFFFPLVLLSQLAASSPWSLLTPEVLAAAPRTFSAWLALSIENTLLIALGLGALAATAAFPAAGVVAAPLLVVLGAVASRLIGRLAWVMAERRP